MVRVMLKIVVALMLIALIVECSALLATIRTSRWVAAEMQRYMEASEVVPEPPLAAMSHGEMGELNFYQATGIKESVLLEWFEKLKAQQNLAQVRLVLTLSSDLGHYLVDGPVALQWADGIEWKHVGSSGLAEFALGADQLKELKVIAPAQYQTLRQRTFALGESYESPLLPVNSQNAAESVDDDRIQQELFRNLRNCRSAESVFTRLNAAETLRCPETYVDISDDQAVAMDSEEIYRQRRSSVVVIGMLLPNGVISQGTGFVLTGTGVIVTNFHVVDKPDAVAAGVLTSDHRFFEVKEFLAGNPSDDLALLKIDSVDLPSIPLAGSNALVGTELMAITHPDSHYFSLTWGRTTRYFLTTRHALPSFRMGVTADFSEGSSGGPLLDRFGNVVGIVSATRGKSSQMVHREAVPVSLLRRLTGNVTDQEQTLVEPAVTAQTSVQQAPTNTEQQMTEP